MARYIETPNIHLRKPDVTDPDKTLGYWGEDLNFSLDTLDTYLWNSIGDVTTLTLPVTDLTSAVNMLDGFRPDYVLKDGKLGGQIIYGGTATGQELVIYNNAVDELGFTIGANGALTSNVDTYESVVLNDDDIPNKKYCDDKFVYINGKSGGQTIYGGTAPGESLFLKGNSDDNIGIEVDGDGNLFSQFLFGSKISGDSLSLNSNNSLTKGKIYLGMSTAYDEANVRLGIGTTSPDYTLEIYKNGVDGTAPFININGSGSLASYTSGFIIFDANAGSTKASLSVTANNTILGSINSRGVNSSNLRASSSTVIRLEQDGAAGATYVPGRITFLTASNSAGASERLRIDSTGLVTATGSIKAAGYKSSDGSDGLTQEVDFIDASAGHHTLTFKNGILTEYELT